MLRDGVCDEITNTERCLYDGGDCCKEDKSTDLCKVCTCKMVIKTNFLNERVHKLAVKMYQKKENLHLMQITYIKNVSDVISLDVCHMICLDEDLDGSVNAWSLFKEHSLCSCSWVEAPVCSIDFYLTQVDNITNSNQAVMLWQAVTSFIQMSKVVQCGKTKEHNA